MRAPTLDEYGGKYPHVRMERSEDGILLVQLHTDGGEFILDADAHHELAFLWRDIGVDEDNKLIILTGSGDAFLRKSRTQWPSEARDRALTHVYAHGHGKRLQMDLLEIEQPMIAALNGPCAFHAEIPLLCDIVLAADHTVIADTIHYEYGLVPGDGIQVILPLLMGLNRARYFMLTGQQLAARECLDLGLVSEVMPQDQLLPRAYELARVLLRQAPAVVRMFRPTVLQHVKRAMLDSVTHGLMMEGMAIVTDPPTGELKVPRVPSDPE